MSRLTRGQSLIGKKGKIEYFSDFTNNFSITPVGDQLAKTTNENSVKQALKNLLFTKPGERFFNPNFGSRILELLFENNIKESLTIAETYIRNSIDRFEPRVVTEGVSVEPSNRSENEIFVTLSFRIINNEDLQTITFLLKRVR